MQALCKSLPRNEFVSKQLSFVAKRMKEGGAERVHKGKIWFSLAFDRKANTKSTRVTESSLHTQQAVWSVV